MSIAAALSTAAAALELSAVLARLTGVFQQNPQIMNASVVVQRLPGEAFKTAQKLAGDVRDLRAELIGYGVDLSQTGRELESSQDWWRLRRNRAIQNFRPRLQGIGDELNVLLSDLVAVAQCFGAEEMIVQSHRDAQDQQNRIRAMTDPDHPVGLIIDDIEALVGEIAAQLGDMR